jgi:ATP-dependent protease ClpP protease subunit
MMKINFLKWIMFLALLLPITAHAENSITLSKSNTLSLNGVVDGSSVGAVIAKAKQLDQKLGVAMFGSNKPLYLFMYTPGGNIQSGLELIEALHGLGRPVHTITLFSASMGFQIVQNLNDRLVLANGLMMSHRAHGTFEGFFGGMTPSQMDQRLRIWVSRTTELDKQTVARTKGKQTLDSYQKAYADEMWLTGQEAVDGGYADRLVTVKCDSSLNGVTTESISFLGIKIEYDTDECPINTGPMNIRIKDAKDKKGQDEEISTEDIKAKFLDSYLKQQRTVVPMSW